MAKRLTKQRMKAPKEAGPVEENGIDFMWGVKIPMRDGVRLNASIYRPKGDTPVPVIFTLTPYSTDGAHPRGMYFAQHGYTLAAVDSRGRGNSEGEFEPFANEAQDGYDLAEWFAAQPWCDGQVAMWGGSYGGYVQWMALREAPPHLKTIVPTASAAAGVDFPFFKNIFSPYEMQWLTYVSGHTRNKVIMEDPRFWITKFQELYRSQRPFSELDQIVGNTSTHFQTWIRHPHPDEYWNRMTFPAEQYDQVDLPILTITGHYDDDQAGAMEYYHQHMRSNSPGKEKHYLIVGPWNHAGTREPKAEFDGLAFSEASILDMNQLHKEWYDWTMKGGAKPSFLKKRIAYYVMGEERWKFADSLEGIPTRPRKLYLDSTAGAYDIFHSGSLQANLHESGTDSYTYDPLDTRYGELEQKPISARFTDQTHDLNLFGNGLVYHSEPFANAQEITGWVKFHAWIAIDVPDTDFLVVLEEILPDGRMIQLTQDLQRARYHESSRVEKLITPGEINCFTFDGFTFFSRRIAKGSRLRLVISCPNTIYLQKNYNSGGVVAKESGEDARTAYVTLYHDREHPSHLELPFAR